MKKNAKIVSLLIAALMLVPAAFSGPVCAEGEVHRYYVAQDADTRGTNDKLVVMACYPGKNTSGNSRFAYWSFDVSDLPAKLAGGKTVASVVLHTYSRNVYDSSLNIDFWNVADTWSEATLNWTNQPLYPFLDDEPTSPAFNFPTVKADMTATMTGKLNDYQWYDFDITKLFRKAFGTEGVPENAVFSFAAQPAYEGATVNPTVHSVSKEDPSSGETHKAYIDITLGESGQLSVVSTTPEDDTTPTEPSKGVKVSFSNVLSGVAASDISITDSKGRNIEVTDADIEVSGKDLIISNVFGTYERYSITISKNISGGMESDYTFAVTTGCNTSVLTADILADTSIRPQPTVVDTVYGASTEIFTNGGAYGLFRLDLSLLDALSVEKAEFAFNVQSSGSPKYTINRITDEWDEATTNWTNFTAAHGDSFIGAKIGDYSFYCSEPGQYASASTAADITEYIKECAAAGLAQTTIAVSYGSVFTISSKESADKPQLRITYNPNPELKAISTAPADGEKGVAADNVCTINISSDIEPAALDFVKLAERGGGEIAATASLSGRTITIEPAAELLKNKTYDIVFKAGFSDKYGNVFENDETIASFTTVNDTLCGALKLTLDSGSAFDDSAAVSVFANGSKVFARAKIENGTAFDASPVLIMCLYDGNRITSVATAGRDSVVAGGAFGELEASIDTEEKGGSAIKAFLWNGADGLVPLCKSETAHKTE